MVFSSAVFVFLFLPLALTGYAILPRILRNAWLLLASLFFYAWGEPVFVTVMLTSVVLNYFLGLWVSSLVGRPSAKAAVGVAVAVNIGLLAFFKYGNFIADNLNGLLAPWGLPTISLPHIPLPIGISFFTFHALSYVIDIYRRDAEVQRNPLLIGLYLSFFPQLVAGPIVRYHDIADQLVRRVVTLEGFAYGVRRFVIGLGKKVIVANTVAVPADAIFGLGTGQLTPGLAWLGALCYAAQIYFDFSGYSDMAIGLARMFGFTFRENFQWPYISKSIREFWRRWHISLSTWFRDYLYIPLGGNRVSPARTYFNLVLVFFLCGLWHGASWTFVVWGVYHGCFLVLERTRFGAWQDRWWAPAQHLYTLLVVLVGWIFFRADTFAQATVFFANMAGVASSAGIEHSVAMYLTNDVALALVVAAVGSTPVAPWLWGRLEGRLNKEEGGRAAALELAASAWQVTAIVAMFTVCAMLLASQTHNPFIYFRF